MSRGWIPTLGCAVFLLAGCIHAPVLWSPDGRWLAFTIAVRSGGPGLPSGWLFDTYPEQDNDFGRNKPGRGGAAAAYRIWATRADTGESVLLEESRGPLTSPAWSPDGKALAFGRLVPERDGHARFEVVLQDGPAHKRVLMTRSYQELSSKAAELPGVTFAWSPDGHYLAIPLLQQSLDLVIIRADNGRVLKVVEDAYLPSWSPDGTKLAFVRGSDAESLHCIDTSFGPPRHLADIGQTCQTPAWSHDSQSIVLIARPRGNGPSSQVELVRIRADNGSTDKIVAMTDDHPDPEKAFLGASFTADHDGENLFYTTDIEGQRALIHWYRPRNKEPADSFHPIDTGIRIGSLALSPTEQTLAVRVGAPGYWAPPGLIDLTSEHHDSFTPIIPDDATRMEWLVTYIDAARRLLRHGLPLATIEGELAERATLLPVPGELRMGNHELARRLIRIGQLGRPLCDRPAKAGPADPALGLLIDEARLFFDYLRKDYTAAFHSLEVLEPQMTDPTQRVRLLSLRAQITLGQGRIAQTNDTLEYLRSLRAGPSHQVEDVPGGPILTKLADPEHLWARYLTQRTEEYARRSARQRGTVDDEPSPFENRNLNMPGDGMFGPFAPPVPRGFQDVPARVEEAPMPPEVRPEIDVVPGADGPQLKVRRRVR